MKTQPNEKEHPFPNKELMLLMKWNSEDEIPPEEIAIISNLIHKYLNLRSDVFHDY